MGRVYTGMVQVAADDSRNSVVALAVSNATPGGAAPAIRADGLLTWTPNESDFSGTTSLTLTVSLATGQPLAVNVRKERTVLDAPLPAAGGTLADADGRYLLSVTPVVSTQAMSGNLRLLELYAQDGSYETTIAVDTTSNASVVVLDAPVAPLNSRQVTAAGASRAHALRAGAAMVAMPAGVADAAPGMLADVGALIGGEGLSGTNGGVLAAGQVNVWTTRSGVVQYSEPSWWPWVTHLSQRAQVFQIDANCSGSGSCRALRAFDNTQLRRAPVILVHGFNVAQSVGGGSGTWGSLHAELTRRGHPVFELRWNTYMRFEEAAGVLARLGRRVAELTGDQAIVVAHSFGGIVAHQALAKQGIQFDGQRWVTVDPGPAFRRLITLGSPLSGIRWLPDAGLDLVSGRDGELSISVCEAVTCYQAGSGNWWDRVELTEVRQKVSALDPTLRGLLSGSEGESIRSLHTAWRTNTAHNVPYVTVVSVRSKPFADYRPDLTDSTAFQLGDGLISMMGQAVIPEDFSASPFVQTPSFQSKLGVDYLALLDTRDGDNMERKDLGGRTYYFAMHAAHTTAWQGGWWPGRYGIVDYPQGGQVSVLSQTKHPLKFFIEDSRYLAEPRTPYTAALPIAHVVRGVLWRSGRATGNEPVRLRLVTVANGAAVSDEVGTVSSADGSFRLNIGPMLADAANGRAFNAADYQVVVNVGDGLQTARYSARETAAVDVNLGDIDITKPAPADAAWLYGSVIDGQTLADPVAGVTLYLMRGLYRDEALVRRVRNTTTSRSVVTNASGQFSLAGLQPGYYTVLAEKVGYLSQTQGAVYLSAATANTKSFSMLRSLPAGAAAITLRWGAMGSGLFVSKDLDAHVLKQDEFGNFQYHIWFGALRGSVTDSLDRDDSDYEGPETVSLQVNPTARYSYWVDNWGYWSGSTIPGSLPSVLARVGASYREFTLPQGDAWTERYWHVFDIVNGNVIPCNQYCVSNISPW